MAHELNIGTINGKTTDQIIDYLIDQMVANKIGNVGKYDGVITGDIVLGNYVDMGGHTWLVCNIDESAGTFNLILNTISEDTEFGSNNNYAGSTVAAKCSAFMSTLPANVLNILKMTTVNGVTAKVFIPSYEQLNGGWQYFNSNSKRIAYDTSGAPKIYWTSTADSSGYVWGVYTGGSFYTDNPSDSGGFRPAVTIQL